MSAAVWTLTVSWVLENGMMQSERSREYCIEKHTETAQFVPLVTLFAVEVYYVVGRLRDVRIARPRPEGLHKVQSKRVASFPQPVTPPNRKVPRRHASAVIF